MDSQGSFKRDAYKLASIEAFYWIAIAIGGYLTVFMQNKGMAASTIGIINAVNSGVAIISVPFWGIVSDKLQSIKKVFIITLMSSMILFPLIALSSHLPVGLLLIPVMVIATYFFRIPAQNLLESWVVQITNVKRMNYGAIRSTGSIAYAIVGIVISFILPYVGVECTFYVFPLFMLPTLLLGFSIRETTGQGSGKKKMGFKDLHIGQLFGDYRYITFIIFVFLYSISTTSEFTFMPYLLENIGVDGSRFGAIYGYRAFFEVPSLFLMVYLRKKIPLRYLVMLGVLCYGIEVFLLSVAGSLTQMILSSTVAGIGSGLLIGSAMNYCFQIAPEQLKATAMTCYGAMGSIAGIVGNLYGGFVLDKFGIITMFRTNGIIIMAALVLYTVSIIFGQKVLKLKSPGHFEA